jgi:hypothetical protein
MSARADVERLHGLGFDVFPCKPDKSPKVRWQDDPPEGGWTFGPDDLIGVRLPVGTVVLDIDDMPAFKASGLEVVKSTVSGTKRKGGIHVFYQTDGRQVAQVTEGHTQGYDTRVGGKGYVIAWDPELWTAVEDWAMAPEWMYEAVTSKAAPAAPDAPMGTRDEVLSWLGTVANKAGNSLTAEDYLGMLDSRRTNGGLIALDSKRPWTDDDLRQIAAEAAKWHEPGRIIVHPKSDPASDDDGLGTVIERPDLQWPAPPAEAAYHGLAGALVNAVKDHTEADPVGLLISVLVTFGALAGNHRWMDQGGRHAPNLFAVQVGQTGIGRKGTTWSVVREMFKAADIDLSSIILPGLESGQGLLTYLRGQPEDPRALILETEFSRLLVAMSRDGSSLSQMVRDAWDGVTLGRYVVSAKQSGKIEDHHIGLLGHITEDELGRKLTSDQQANGFGNRILWTATKRMALQPFAGSLVGYVSSFAGGLKAALTYAQRLGSVTFDDRARERWEGFYRTQPPRIGLSGNMTARADAQVARLAMVYALLDRTNVIQLEHLEAALAFWGYAERSVLYIFGDSTGDRLADSLMSELRHGGSISWNEAKKELGFRTAADLEEATELLTRLGRIRVTKATSGKGGRARRTIELITRG